MSDLAVQIEKLRHLLTAWRADDEDEDERLTTLESLTDVLYEDILRVAEESLSSEDELIRCHAVEFLGGMSPTRYEQRIREVLHGDPSWLVRRNAAISAGRLRLLALTDDVLERLGAAEEEERVGLYYAASRLTGRSDLLLKFLEGLLHEHYRIRCATAHLVSDLVDEHNRSFVVALVTTQLKGDASEAAREALSRLLEELQSS